MTSPADTAHEPQKSSSHESLSGKVRAEIEVNLNNEQFSVEYLAERMNMCRSHLHRKLKKATGQSPNQFIREYRLQRAMELLKQEDKSISEIAYAVGFGSPSYFTTCFTEFYGYPPSEANNRLAEIPHTAKPDERESRHPVRKMDGFTMGSLAMIGTLMAIIWYQNWVMLSPIRETRNTTVDRSIAVLPFKNLNDHNENQYFSEGITEAINRYLSQVDGLRIISSTSTARYQESGQSAREIGRELGVSKLLEGSIQRYENTVRIEVRLIDVQTDEQLWAANYDRELKDIFKTQSEIAEQVARALKATLSPEEKAIFSQKMTDNAEAYDLYLKGIYENRTFTRSGNLRGIEYFKQALALDSGYALVYTGLAQGYIARASIYGTELSTLDAFALAKPLLDKALALDPDLPEAHTWNGFYLLYNNWDFEGAEQEYKKAIVANFPDALAAYADFLNFTRRHEEAHTISRRLDQTDPYYPNTRMILSLFYTHQYEEAEAFARSRVRVFNNYYTLDSYGFLMLNTGNYPKAIELFQRVMDIEEIRYPRMLGWMGAAYAHSGEREKALELLEELKANIPVSDAGSIRFFIAVIYTALDNKSSALQWLQAAFEQHEMEVPWLISEPQFYALHEEPAFRDLVNKIGFPQ